jgi:hypothetical protein
VSSAEPPAAVVRQAIAEFRKRAQNPCLRQTERDQFYVLADLFGRIADLMESYDAYEDGGLVMSQYPVNPRDAAVWTDTLIAARAWLVPTPTEPR